MTTQLEEIPAAQQAIGHNPAAAPLSGVQFLYQMMTAFAATQILFAADELNVFDDLAGGSSTAAEIASRLKLRPELLERLLVGCVANGLLDKDGDRYSLNDVSRGHLVKSSPGYIGRGFGHIRHDLYPLWQHLSSAVREGRPQWAKIPGMDPAGPFESMYKSEAGVRTFMEVMFSMTYPAALEYAERFDFSRFAHIVDVGGASGAFFAAVLAKNPGVRGTIFDLPPVEKPARECMERFGLSDRAAFVPGDFFRDSLPQGADMYVLGFILHDWSREQGTLLLKKIYEALPDHGAVFIAEALFDEKKAGPPSVAFMDLNMLVATYGEERTPAEYESWLKEVGFARVEHQYCNGPKSYVVGYKK